MAIGENRTNEIGNYRENEKAPRRMSANYGKIDTKSESFI